MVNAVLSSDNLLPTAMKSAQALAEKPAAALRATKDLMKRTYQAEVDRALREEVEVISERLESAETREALAAFWKNESRISPSISYLQAVNF